MPGGKPSWRGRCQTLADQKIDLGTRIVTIVTRDVAANAFHNSPCHTTARTYARVVTEEWRRGLIDFTAAADVIGELQASGFLVEAMSIIR